MLYLVYKVRKGRYKDMERFENMTNEELEIYAQEQLEEQEYYAQFN